MRSIEIVTHCWAGRYAHYAHSLTYQLSSLVLHRSSAPVLVALCFDPQDSLVSGVIDFFRGEVDFKLFPMKVSDLGRRSIGRNKAALETQADVVWFTDCDHVFHDGCLDHLADLLWPEWAPMVYAKTIMIHKDWATGDAALVKARVPTLVNIDPNEFMPKRYNKAIGGVQIVRGDFAREHGYLRDIPRWQRPYHGDRQFDSCVCDKAYRRFIQDRRTENSILPIDLPGLYRLRHTQTTHHD